MTVGEQAVRASGLNAARVATSVVVAVCSSAIIARVLGPRATGTYSYAVWVGTLLAVVANLGFPQTLCKYVSEYQGRGDVAAAAQIARRLLVAQLYWAACITAAGLAVALLVSSPSHRILFAIAAASALPQVMLQAFSGVLSGMRRFDQTALLGFCTGMVQIALFILAATLHTGVLGMLAATIVGLSAGAWVSRAAVDRLLLSRSGIPSQEATNAYQRVYRFSMTVAYILLLDTIVWQRSEVLFLKLYSTLPQIAFYSLAFSLAGRLGDVGGTFTGVLMPFCSATMGGGGVGALAPVYVKSIRYTEMIMVPLCIFGVTAAAPAVTLVYGAAYLPVVPVLRVLLGSLLFTCVGTVASAHIYAIGRPMFIAKYGTAVAALNLALDFALIPRLGALGAALANSTSQLIGVTLGVAYVCRLLSARFPWRPLLRIYCAGLLASGPLVCAIHFGSRGGTILGCLATSLCLYVVFLRAAGEIGAYEIEVLKASLRRAAPGRVAGANTDT